MAASLQVSNPVIGFSGDNNGVMLQLPAVAVSGAPSATGTLYFGVDTQSNNALGTAKAFPTTLDGNGQAVIATSYKSSSYGSFLDSGSNGLFFRMRRSIPARWAVVLGSARPARWRSAPR